jgi:hypothetical protein
MSKLAVTPLLIVGMIAAAVIGCAILQPMLVSKDRKEGFDDVNISPGGIVAIVFSIGLVFCLVIAILKLMSEL